MVAPAAIDLEIGARAALFREADAFQQIARRFVFRLAGGFDTVQGEILEAPLQQGAHGVADMALALVRLADPIADRAGMRRAAPYLRKRNAADELLVIAAEDEERISAPVADIFGVAAQLVAISRPREFVIRPGRLPRRQDLAAGVAHGDPLRIVARLRVAQIHARPDQLPPALTVAP